MLNHKLFITIMKAAFTERSSVGGSRRITVFAVCMAFLLTSMNLAHCGTGFTLVPGTNVYNFYDSNGTSGQDDGIDPSPAFSGSPAMSWVYFDPAADSGMIAPVGKQTVNSTVITIPSGSGTIPGAYVKFLLGSATLTSGANPTGLSTPAPGGVALIYLTMYLNNPNPAPDEVRFDWNAIYSYSGPSNNTTLGAPGSPLSVIISGYLSSVGSYYALAGGETVYNLTGGSITATIGNGTAPGDGFTDPGSVLGAGPWNGQEATSTTITYPAYYSDFPTAPFLPTGGLTVNPGDYVGVQGYLDLVVDPGAITVQIGPVQPPLLGITTYSNLPVVFFPTTPGTNFVVQMTSDLNTSNWVTVTNGISISGIIITNPTSPAFFRLN
jgi:hypothetical protein